MVAAARDSLAQACQMLSSAPERFCFVCGESLGKYAPYDRYDTCGKETCLVAMHNSLLRDEAERQSKIEREMRDD